MRNEHARIKAGTSSRATSAWWLLAVLVATQNACGTAPTESTPPAAAPVAAPSPETATALQAVLAAYERARVSLADDAIAKGLEDAGAIETAATAAVGAASAPIAAVLRDIASAAGALKATGAGDADGVRKAFGEVSRGVVGLASAVPSLQGGLHMFECPMAQGYKRWVQPGAEMANPYMGKAMLKCGAPRTW